MDWVKRRLEEEKELRQHRESLASGTPPLWKGLCQALQDSVREYPSAPHGRFEPDARNHHVFWVRYLEDDREKKKVTIVLDSTNGTIHAEYEGVSHDGVPYPPRKLNLGLDKGTVCLEDESGEFDSEGAAAHFLDPFLFPNLAHIDLPRTSVYQKGGIRSVGY